MLLKEDAVCPFNVLSDLTCVDWYPSEPRFEVIYHLLSIPNKERVRLKVRLNSAQSGAGFDYIRSGLEQIISSAKFLICSASVSLAILIYDAF